jgi:hypothetical protein
MALIAYREKSWLGDKDSNLDNKNQNLVSYH